MNIVRLMLANNPLNPPPPPPPQLLSHMHATLGDELTDASSVAKLPDAAQVSFISVLFVGGHLHPVFTRMFWDCVVAFL